MSQPPVPVPRTRMIFPESTQDDKLLKCGFPPQHPIKSPETQGGLVSSTPPPVSPKKWTVKKSSGGSENINGRLEIVKVLPKQSVNDNYKAQPSPLPPRPPKQQLYEEILDPKALLTWWKTVTPWNSVCIDLRCKGESEKKIITVKAEQLYKAVQVYIILLSERGDTLKTHTSELLSIADNLDKVSKGTKIAGITGGATSVAGGVAAAAGVILSPFTLGASLALTVVGVGVAAAGGVTGASAAIAHKVNITQDKKKLEKILKDYEDLMEDINNCLNFVNEGMEQLKQHGLSALNEARMDSLKVARVIELTTTGGTSTRTIEANSKASGLIQGFALGMDFFFTQGKGEQKVKKGLESKFAKKIRKLAEELNKGLDELWQIKDLFSKC